MEQESGYLQIGRVLGVIVGIGTFIVTWILLIFSGGFILGLGWAGYPPRSAG